MNSIPFLLERKNDRTIYGWWHLPKGKAKGTVLFLHGYKGYMDWGAWKLVGHRMASEGWRMLRINFTHNGTTVASPSAFRDLEAFADNTYRRERDEAMAVLCALRQPASIPDSVALDAPLAVIGHSRGGGIACLAGERANEHLLSQGKRGVDAIVSWAGVADFASRFPQGEAREQWRNSGQLEIINHRTRQRLHHNWSFLEDFEAHEDELTIEKAVLRYPGHLLAAHGSADAAVSLDHAQRLVKWAQNGQLHVLPDAGHTFGAAEPWQNPTLPSELEALTQTTLRFLEEGRAVH
jgi:alpha-beta hydrolase superfamily lysophospholipase